MRFLDPDNLATNNLGKAFPINVSYGEVLTYANFFGLKNAQLVVDTGCTVDAALEPKFVQQELQTANSRSDPTKSKLPQVFQYAQFISTRLCLIRRFIGISSWTIARITICWDCDLWGDI